MKTLIVSNRLPMALARDKDGTFQFQASSGGLVSGLREVHGRGESKWIGFVGHETRTPGQNAHLAKHGYCAVDISSREYELYYDSMSNGSIWPLFHYRADAMKFSQEAWDAYVRVNQRFADAVISIAEPDDWIWVHDYQLMLLPAMLRERRPNQSIAYFHHIPFPASDVFRIFPRRDELLQGLLGADLVGFHTLEYVSNFAVSITRLLGYDTHLDTIVTDQRDVRIGAFPLGVDVNFAQKTARSDVVQAAELQFKKDLGDVAVILGVDRLDYTKGIPQRLLAFREFLDTNPSMRGHCTLIQICVPSRGEVSAYKKLRADVERLVSQINGKYAHPGYVPIQYIHRAVSSVELYALYRMASVAMVTPLRDGLNLVCKEYVASRTDDSGVLVLSEFAGAAAELGEAIKVNPYDIGGMAQALAQAIMMPKEEQGLRMRALRRRMVEFDNIAWAGAFMAAWSETQDNEKKRSKRLVEPYRRIVLEKLKNASRRILCLDYDGTLVRIANTPSDAIPQKPDIDFVRMVAEARGVELAIVTGRPREFCEVHFGLLPVHLVSEHGSFLHIRGETEWQKFAPVEEFQKLRPELLRLFSLYTRFVPGAFIEEKECSAVWHYRQADRSVVRTVALELVEVLGRLLRSTPFAVYPGRAAIEIRSEANSKGKGIEGLLERLTLVDSDVIITAGDDVTDETMYKVAGSQNVSIHVGRSSDVASFHLSSPDELRRLLSSVVSE